MEKTILGIDIAKKKFDVVLLRNTNKEKHEIFSNDQSGFLKLIEWLSRHKVLHCHVCLEATGFYGEELALFLYERGYKVSVVNPSRIKAYARSELSRNKTDKADSGVIARFCKAHCPPLWNPPLPALSQLRELYRCSQSLKEDKFRVINRLEKFQKKETVTSKVWKDILSSIEENINNLEKEISLLLDSNPEVHAQWNLLKSIPGIGGTTATAILAELPDVKEFSNAREVAAFAGLTPCQRQSGTSCSSGKLA